MDQHCHNDLGGGLGFLLKSKSKIISFHSLYSGAIEIHLDTFKNTKIKAMKKLLNIVYMVFITMIATVQG